MKSTVVVAAALATAAYAQTQSSPLIPAGTSPGCATFLGGLDKDTTMSTCLQSLSTATAAFGPNASGPASASDVPAALAQMCSSTTCDPTTLRSQLSDFYTACSNDIQNSPDVCTLFDALYALPVMMDVACLKDGPDYCVSKLNAAPTTRKRDGAQAVIKLNADAFATQGIPFLRLSPSSPSSTLCSNCAKSVMQTWVKDMNAQPYAPGLSESKMLAGWGALYNGTLATCGADFLDTTGTQNAAGALGNGVLPGGSSGAVEGASSSVLSMLGALALAALAL